MYYIISLRAQYRMLRRLTFHFPQILCSSVQTHLRSLMLVWGFSEKRAVGEIFNGQYNLAARVVLKFSTLECAEYCDNPPLLKSTMVGGPKSYINCNRPNSSVARSIRSNLVQSLTTYN